MNRFLVRKRKCSEIRFHRKNLDGSPCEPQTKTVVTFSQILNSFPHKNGLISTQ